MSDTTDPLEECLNELRSAEEENEQLRASANAFADLAERLKASLEHERRMKALSAPLVTPLSTREDISTQGEEDSPRNEPPLGKPES